MQCKRAFCLKAAIKLKTEWSSVCFGFIQNFFSVWLWHQLDLLWSLFQFIFWFGGPLFNILSFYLFFIGSIYVAPNSKYKNRYIEEKPTLPPFPLLFFLYVRADFFLSDTKLIHLSLYIYNIFVVYNEINKIRSSTHFIIPLLLLKMHVSIFTYVLGIKTWAAAWRGCSGPPRPLHFQAAVGWPSPSEFLSRADSKPSSGISLSWGPSVVQPGLRVPHHRGVILLLHLLRSRGWFEGREWR